MDSGWKCKKCGLLNDPEVYDNTRWRCSKCRSLRRPWLAWVMVTLILLFCLIPILIGIPGININIDFLMSQVKSNSSSEAKPTSSEEISDILQVQLQFQKEDDSEPSPALEIGSQELQNLELSARDNYRLFISPKRKGIFLYVYQLDLLGNIDRIFPHPVYSKADNPIEENQTYQIPPDENSWLHFDTLQPSTHSSITETLHIVAVDHRLEKLENIYTSIHASTAKEQRDDLLKQFQEEFHSVSKQSTPVYYKAFSIDHIR